MLLQRILKFYKLMSQFRGNFHRKPHILKFGKKLYTFNLEKIIIDLIQQIKVRFANLEKWFTFVQ